MIGKKLRKIMSQLLLMFCMLKHTHTHTHTHKHTHIYIYIYIYIHILLMFQNITQILKTSCSFNNSKWRKMALSCSQKVILYFEVIKTILSLLFFLKENIFNGKKA